MRIKALTLSGFLLVMMICACKNKSQKNDADKLIFKGLYSLGPEAKIFKNCSTGSEYWVVDRSKALELKYWQTVPTEMSNSPVYVEVEGFIASSDPKDDGDGAFDSTLVVKKLIKITKGIPNGMCN